MAGRLGHDAATAMVPGCARYRFGACDHGCHPFRLQFNVACEFGARRVVPGIHVEPFLGKQGEREPFDAEREARRVAVVARLVANGEGLREMGAMEVHRSARYIRGMRRDLPFELAFRVAEHLEELELL